jgi:hypothetical protein
MRLKWTLPVLLVTLTAAAQMPSAMDQFMQVMEASMTKMDKGMAGAPMTGDVDHDFDSGSNALYLHTRKTVAFE